MNKEYKTLGGRKRKWTIFVQQKCCQEQQPCCVETIISLLKKSTQEGIDSTHLYPIESNLISSGYFNLYFLIKNISLKCAITYLDSGGGRVDEETFVKTLCTVTEICNLVKITTTFLIVLFMLYFLSQTIRAFSNALLCFTDSFCWLLPNPQLVCSAKFE